MQKFGINFSKVRKDYRRECDISLQGGSMTFFRPPFLLERNGLQTIEGALERCQQCDKQERGVHLAPSRQLMRAWLGGQN